MNRRISMIAGAFLVSAIMLCALLVQSRHLAVLQAGRQQGTPAIDAPSNPSLADPASLTTQPDTNGMAVASEILKLRGEVTRLTERKRELAGIRGENSRLQAQLASTNTNSSNPSIGLVRGYVRKNQARFVGYKNPEDTLQSFLWSLQNHDYTNMLQALTPNLAQNTDFRLRQSGRSLEDFWSQSEGFVGMGIVKRHDLDTGGIEVDIQVAAGFPDLQFHLEEIADQWKISSGL